MCVCVFQDAECPEDVCCGRDLCVGVHLPQVAGPRGGGCGHQVPAAQALYGSGSARPQSLPGTSLTPSRVSWGGGPPPPPPPCTTSDACLSSAERVMRTCLVPERACEPLGICVFCVQPITTPSPPRQPNATLPETRRPLLRCFVAPAPCYERHR